MKAEVTYLYNSGFLVQSGDIALVFDDWKDPADVMQKALDGAEAPHAVYFFASHNHYDHFDPHIFRYAGAGAQYVLSREDRKSTRLNSSHP